MKKGQKCFRNQGTKQNRTREIGREKRLSWEDQKWAQTKMKKGEDLNLPLLSFLNESFLIFCTRLQKFHTIHIVQENRLAFSNHLHLTADQSPFFYKKVCRYKSVKSNLSILSLLLINPQYIIKMNSTKDNLHSNAQHLEIKTAICLTSCLLTDLMEEEGGQCNSIFNSNFIPNMSIESYCQRIYKYTNFSPECLIIALIYFDRYNMEEEEFYLNQSNAYRILLGCLVLSVKFNDDKYYDNEAFGKAGGVSLAELFNFELEIAEKLEFKFFVTADEYETLLERLTEAYVEQ